MSYLFFGWSSSPFAEGPIGSDQVTNVGARACSGSARGGGGWTLEAKTSGEAQARLYMLHGLDHGSPRPRQENGLGHSLGPKRDENLQSCV